MVPPTDHPLIDPTTFDLLVVGTSLPEAILAAAASASGKTVLHLDPNPFYGSHTTSLSLSDFTSFLQSSPASDILEYPSDSDSYCVLNLRRRALLSDVEIRCLCPAAELDALAGNFLLDVCAPRAIFSASEEIDLLIRSGASNYVEFKSIEACFIYQNGETAKLSKVPDSRSAIFKDKGLSLTEKNQLMRFFKLVQSHLGASSGASLDEPGEGETRQIPQADLESPFVEFLSKMKLPSNVQSMILYGIAMADYDQESNPPREHLLTTKEGLTRLALYQSSVGRFANTVGAMLYPVYGQGELPQSFCRCAAVKGCVYVLRMPVIALLVDKNDGSYKGIKLASGQDIFSENLALDSNYVIPSHLSSPLKTHDESQIFNKRVARGVCIIRSSLVHEASNLVIVFPPRSLFSEQITAVRALQVGSNLAVCPTGMYILYLSAQCNDIDGGKKLIMASMDSILSSPENPGSAKPELMWSSVYIQELPAAQFGYVCNSPMPGGAITHTNLLEEAMELFKKMYSGEAFFPEAAKKSKGEEDNEEEEEEKL